MHSPFSLNQRRFRGVNAILNAAGKEEVAQGTSDIRHVVTFSSVVQIASRSPVVVRRQTVCPTVQSRPSARQVHGGSETGGPGVKGCRRTGSCDWPDAGQQISVTRIRTPSLHMNRRIASRRRQTNRGASKATQAGRRAVTM
jgi:hypothetical protein